MKINTLIWPKWFGFIALGLGLGGCGVAAVATGSAPATIPFRVHITAATGLIRQPRWVTSPGVTAVPEGFATGYMLNATHNAVVWKRGSWRFQVLGPFVTAQPAEAELLRATFQHTRLRGTGVVSLAETDGLWHAAISWQDASRVWDVRFAMPGTNTAIVRALVLQLAERVPVRAGTLACRVTLRAADGETAIRDVMRCGTAVGP